jgi:hypothetical protein
VINQRFYIPGGVRLARKITRQCVKCYRLQGQPRPQEEAKMPDFRVGATTNLHPFTHTSVDAAGPFEVTVLRSTRKVWLLVFVCLTYQIVHLEIINSMDAATFLKAFGNFISRRGTPDHVHSDNGGNFVKGSAEIERSWMHMMQTLSIDAAREFPRVKWTFSPPLSPHNNGLCERMVGTAKKAMKAIMPMGRLTEEDFRAYVTRAEGLINTRPLGYVSGHAGDLTALTPNHFLRGRLSCDISPQEMADFSLYRKLQRLEEEQHKFWARYVQEVLPGHHRTNSWTSKVRNFEVGDIVATADVKVRGVWPLAKVVRIYPDPDEVVRKVDVLQKGRVLQRSVGQLLLLVDATK